jgi:hypothetical protein
MLCLREKWQTNSRRVNSTGIDLDQTLPVKPSAISLPFMASKPQNLLDLFRRSMT